MAYQNVGTPRFFIDCLSWWQKLGIIDSTSSPFTHDKDILNLIGLNPANVSTLTGGTGGHDDITFKLNTSLVGMFPEKIFAAVLGHNLGSAESSFVVYDAVANIFLGNGLYVNWEADETAISYDGFSISKDNDGQAAQTDEIIFRFDHEPSDLPWDIPLKIGSLALGVVFEMPNAPNLSLTMSREYGGTKEFTTHSGASMSNTMWSKPPSWGSLGAWELSDPGSITSQALSRSGRKTWHLKFSYMDDGDLWGSNQSLSTFLNDPSGLDSADFSLSGSSILGEDIMETYPSYPFSTFSATSTGFTGTHDGANASIASTALDSSDEGDLSITAGTQYKVSFYLTIASGARPKVGLAATLLGSYSDGTAKFGEEGYNELYFTATETTSVALVEFFYLNFMAASTITVSNLECRPTESQVEGFTNNLLNEVSFFAQVWQKTLGGSLKFIFQADSSNNNPDQFTICRFVDKSLKATQTGVHTYDISVKIEESW